MRRIYGIRWKQAGDVDNAESTPMTFLPSSTPLPSSALLIRSFLQERCCVSAASDAYIDIETRVAPQGERRYGLRTRRLLLSAAHVFEGRPRHCGPCVVTEPTLPVVVCRPTSPAVLHAAQPGDAQPSWQ